MAPHEECLPVTRADISQEGSRAQHRHPGHQSTASNASSSSSSSNSNTDDSEESYLDSLEEGRTPLLGGADHIDDEELDGRGQRGTNVMYSNEDRGHTHRYPKERHKTWLAFGLLFIAGCMNDLVLSFIHEYVPDTAPLPDIVFAHTPYIPWALRISEYLMLSSFGVLMLLAISHKHRWIIFRRIATIGSLLYFGRCVTMFVTQVPKADPNYHCSPKLDVGLIEETTSVLFANHSEQFCSIFTTNEHFVYSLQPENRTLSEVVLRALRILSGLGLAINGKHTLCGDYIYSGHTVVLVTCYLFIREYSPRHWRFLHWISAIASTVGVFCLLISRGHYTVDVVIAYWITTRVFWQYHTLAGFAVLRDGRQEHNHLTKIIWYPLFRYMESNVLRPLPHKYGLPFSCSWDRIRRIRMPKTNDQ
ncbi:PAP2-C domain-containing protein [Aphelenchoides bicaudatus]|nr:PAP2-C domain-containing protein [Aphelenchoides bicaudatus]